MQKNSDKMNEYAYNIYVTCEFREKMQSILKRGSDLLPSAKRPRQLKFEFNMADDTNSADGDANLRVAGGDAINGPSSDLQTNSCGRHGPFLIGVAGGTASGKVNYTVNFMHFGTGAAIY